SSRRRHTRFSRDWSSDVCSSDLMIRAITEHAQRDGSTKPFASSQLAAEMPIANACREIASGVLAVFMATEVPSILIWFRAEQLRSEERRVGKECRAGWARGR